MTGGSEVKRSTAEFCFFKEEEQEQKKSGKLERGKSTGIYVVK